MKNYWLKSLGATTAIATIWAALRSESKAQIAPRRREGRVREFPRSQASQTGAGIGAFLSTAGMAGALLAKKGNPILRLSLGAAAAAGLTASIDHMQHKKDPSSNILAAGLAGVGMLTASLLLHKNINSGLSSLKSFLQTKKLEAPLKIANSLTEMSKNFPLVERVVAQEGVAIAGGLLTFPVAHSLMVKYLAKEKRRHTDHGDSSMLPTYQDNNAGSVGSRKSVTNLIMPNESLKADVKFSGSVNSYYNPSSLFEDM